MAIHQLTAAIAMQLATLSGTQWDLIFQCRSLHPSTDAIHRTVRRKKTTKSRGP